VIELGGVQVLGGKVEVGSLAIKAVASRASHFEKNLKMFLEKSSKFPFIWYLHRLNLFSQSNSMLDFSRVPQ
jgi:hypothetical protein